ncbi:hypothetical protein ACS6XX_06165 [Streptococcus suis]
MISFNLDEVVVGLSVAVPAWIRVTPVSVKLVLAILIAVSLKTNTLLLVTSVTGSLISRTPFDESHDGTLPLHPEFSELGIPVTLLELVAVRK